MDICIYFITMHVFGREYILLDRDEGVKAHVVQSELGEIERDLTLRRLLWESSEELTKLVEEWTATTFDQLNVESLQKNVNRFTQTVYMLEKGLTTPIICLLSFILC